MLRVCSLLFLSLLVGRASAEIQLIGQARTLTSFGLAQANGEIDEDIQRAAATDAPRFEEIAAVAARGGTATADGFASQVSLIGASRMSGTLAVDAFVGGTLSVDDLAEASGSSIFHAVFQVDRPSTFLLDVSGDASLASYAALDLWAQPAHTTLAAYDTDGALPASQRLTLLPGVTYELYAVASTSVSLLGGDGQPDGQATFAFSLAAVPEPAAFAWLGTLALGGAAFGWQKRR